ncbi:type I glutamate--ammonia ligase [Candidatus Woesearchaeota archaeon]|nr:MAG: type I glutamate--ammonia ligase [Candidatus Woesearchaeota archaeon]
MKKEISNEEVLKQVEKDGVKFVNLQFTDMTGSVKNVTITVSQLPEALEKGIWFDGSSIEGFTRIHESDMYLVPDKTTYAVIPWLEGEEKSCRFICDVYTPDGRPFEGDPRYILKKVMKEAEEMGYVYNTGPELEFFIFKKENSHIEPLPHDKGSYFDLTMDEAYEIRRQMVLALQKMGITVETSHHEVAAGQHEIDFKYGDALTTADNAVTFKYTLKAIAQQNGLFVSFMPKPIAGINGSGMHVHQSLFDVKTGKNAFYDGSDKYNLSETAYHFLAGQLKYIREIAALTNPLVNSYKRLVPGYEAATYICWAQINRSALIRIPRTSEGRTQSTRMEIRCPDPSANPYLAFAALLKAGLKGIKEKLKAPEPVEEDVFEFTEEMLRERGIEYLPYSLWQAVKAMKEGTIAREILGEQTFNKYVRAKTLEWDSFRTAVTDWEIRRYLELV